MKEIKFKLPTNYKLKTKKEKSCKFIGMNWYRNAHHFTNNNMKIEYTFLVNKELEKIEPVKFNEYEIKAVFNYELAISDLDNSIVVTKFMNDALQKLKVTKGDSVKHCKRIILEVGDKAKKGEGTIDFTIREFNPNNEVEELRAEIAKLTAEVIELNEELNHLHNELECNN